jgi:DNA-binding Lrp family transcriptional regulator
MKNKEQFLKIPYSILENKILSDGEKITLMLIYSYHNNDKKFYMSNSVIGERIGCSRTAVSKRITKLEKMGLIQCDYTYKNNSKEVDKRFITPLKVVPKFNTVVPKVSVGGELIPQGSSSGFTEVVPKVGSIILPSLLDKSLDKLLDIDITLEQLEEINEKQLTPEQRGTYFQLKNYIIKQLKENE